MKSNDTFGFFTEKLKRKRIWSRKINY